MASTRRLKKNALRAAVACSSASTPGGSSGRCAHSGDNAAMPPNTNRPTRCSWCGQLLTERAIFGSERYHLDRHDAWACDSCLENRVYEVPPPDSTVGSTDWSFRDPVADSRKGSPPVVIAFALALAIGSAVWAVLRADDLGWPSVAGLAALFALGGLIAARRPLPTRRRSDAEGFGLFIGGFGAVLLLRRIGETNPVVAVVLTCGGALILGWSAVSLFRIGLALRPGGTLYKLTSS